MACDCGKAECPERHGITLRPRCKAEEWQRDGRGRWARRICLHLLTNDGLHAGKHEFSPWHYDAQLDLVADFDRVAAQRDELLEALKEAAEHLGDLSRPLDVRVEDAYCVTKAAIAKAEGKPAGDDASREAATRMSVRGPSPTTDECQHCGGLPPGEASSAGDLCHCVFARCPQCLAEIHVPAPLHTNRDDGRL